MASAQSEHVCAALSGEAGAMSPDTTVEDYARHLYRPVSVPASGISKRARDLFEKAVLDYDPLRAWQAEQLRVLADSIRQGITIETGPHCQLVLDPVTQATLQLSRIGLRVSQQRALVWYGCSTVTLESSAFAGPGWLSVNGRPANVFGLSRRRLAHHSVCASLDRVNFAPVLADRSSSPSKLTILNLDLIKETFPPAAFRSPAAAFHSANQHIWSAGNMACDAPLITLDDDFASHLVALHLSQSDSLLSRVLFQPERCQRLLGAAAAEANAPDPDLKWNTDFFWHFRAGRIRSMRQVGGMLFEKAHPDEFVLPFRRDEILSAIETGVLRPSLFVVLLVLGILPGFRVLGGPYQMRYYPSFVRIVKTVLDLQNADETAFATDMSDGADHGWSLGVIDPSLLPAIYPFQADYRAQIEALIKLPIDVSSLDFAALRFAGPNAFLRAQP